MASGTVTDSCASTVTASNNSCEYVRAAFYQWQLDHAGLWQPFACSSDPVVVGTQVQYLHSISGANASCSITGITATATAAADSVTSDVNTVVALMVIGVFFAFFYGFSSGKGFFR